MFGISLSGAFARVKATVSKVIEAGDFSKSSRSSKRAKDPLCLGPSYQPSDFIAPETRGSSSNRRLEMLGRAPVKRVKIAK